MTLLIGLNFRNSSGYVTDGANETYVIDTDSYPTTRGGATFGWEDGPTSDRDYSTSSDRRLAGVNYTGTTAGTDNFRVDLDAATDHDIGFAGGAISFTGWGPDAVFKDDTTSFKTAQGTPAASNFIDIQSAEYSYSTFFANWSLQSHTFSSTILRVTNGHGSGSGANPPIAHLFVEQTGSGSGTTLSPAVGSIAIAGQAATVIAETVLAPAVGSASFSGFAATITGGTTLLPGVGSITAVGQAATLIQERVIVPAVGAVTAVGQAASAFTTTTIAVAAGAISIAGQAVTLIQERVIVPAVGTITAVGFYCSVAIGGVVGAIGSAFRSRYRRLRRGRDRTD